MSTWDIWHMLVEIDIFICYSIYFQSMKLEIGSQYTYYTLVSIAQKIFSKKFELAVSKARLKSNLDDNTIQSGKKSWKKVENGGIWTQGHTHHPLKLPRFTTVRQRKIDLSNFRGISGNFRLYTLLTYQWTY